MAQSWNKLTDEKLKKKVASLEKAFSIQSNENIKKSIGKQLDAAKKELESRGGEVEKAVKETTKEAVKDAEKDVKAVEEVADEIKPKAKKKGRPKKTTTTKKTRAKQKKVSTGDFEMTIDGVKYKFSDAKSKEQCQKAIAALKARKAQVKKASGAYRTKSVTSKITSGMETIARQAVDEAKSHKATESQIKKRVDAVEKAFNDLFNKLEELMGKKISNSDRKAVMSILQGYEKKQTSKVTTIKKKEDGGEVDWSDVDVDNELMRYGGEVEGTYGGSQTPTTVYFYEDRGGKWYAADGSVNVNYTYDDIEDGVDIETLRDEDMFTASKPIESEDDIERELYEDYKKGGKTQGYNSRLDESLGTSRKRITTHQDYKDRRDESKGMKKASGKRAYSRVKTMDKKMDGGSVNGWDWSSFL